MNASTWGTKKITEFTLKLTTIVNEIRALGTKVEESDVVEKLLRSVPDKFLSIVGAIEQWGDVSAMSVMEAIGRLRVYEESLKGRRCDKEEGEHLLLTRAEWEARAAEEKRSGKDSDSGTNGGRGDGRGCGQDDDKKKTRRSTAESLTSRRSSASIVGSSAISHSSVMSRRKDGCISPTSKMMTSQLS